MENSKYLGCTSTNNGTIELTTWNYNGWRDGRTQIEMVWAYHIDNTLIFSVLAILIISQKL